MTTKTGSKLVNSVRRARTNQAEQKSDEAVVESLDVKQPKTTVIEPILSVLIFEHIGV